MLESIATLEDNTCYKNWTSYSMEYYLGHAVQNSSLRVSITSSTKGSKLQVPWFVIIVAI